jgi:hypothetical protein
MNTTKVCAILAIPVLMFFSCTSVRTTASWINQDKIQTLKQSESTIFISVLTQNLRAKSILENDLAKAATSKGLQAIKSIDVFGPVPTRETLPSKDDVLKKIRELGCDAILTVAVVDKQSDARYVPGTVYAPYGRFGYYGRYYGARAFLYDPGYYTTDKTYFLETNLYDAKTEEMLFSIQSKAVNPPAIERASQEYTASILQELDKQGLFKK